MRRLVLDPYTSVDCSLQSRIKEIEDEKERRVRSKSEKESSFLGSLVVALKEKTHTDIQLRPGKNNGPCIPAHRVILASRSKILKQMLECDPTPSHTLTFPELNREELESLLEFLYGGSLGKDKMEKHVRILLHAADKYDIPYLQECCERCILESLNVSNVLDALVVSDVCSSKTIMDAALKFIVRNMDQIMVNPEYEAFVAKNPRLSIYITRAYVNHARSYVPKNVPSTF